MTRSLIFLIAFAGAHLINAQVPIINDDFRVNLEEGQKQEEIDFFELPYRTTTLDLRGLKGLTDYEIPESAVITPPDNLHTFNEVVVLVGLFGELETPTMIIMLAGNYSSRRVTFFTDQNQDRDFTNDAIPSRVVKGTDSSSISLSTEAGEQSLTLRLPNAEKKESKSKTRIGDGFSVALTGAVGSGNIKYEYDDLTIGFPTTYKVRVTEKMFRAALAYDIKRFHFGVSASFQNFFFYTSKLTIKQGEPERITVPGTNRVIIRENAEERINDDSHNPNRVQMAVFAGYKFPIGKTFDIQPIAAFGLTSYLDPEYNYRPSVAGEVYSLQSTPFYEVGLRGEFAVGIEKSFFIEVVRNATSWEPENFPTGVELENFDASNVTTKISVGFRFAI
ncbi:MAG: hypothetical protein ABJG78_03525 [Cyclobacteriaceae bacterium]